MEGLTGHIMFNDDGKRYNYTLHVVQMTIDSTITKVRIFKDVYSNLKNLINKVLFGPHCNKIVFRKSISYFV